MKEALLYEHLDHKIVHCHLCPHECVIPAGKTGYCGVRKNIDGILYALTYGKVSSIAVDPIEKNLFIIFTQAPPPFPSVPSAAICAASIVKTGKPHTWGLTKTATA